MYVIAGVSGHVGAVSAEQLIAAGKKVKVIVRDPQKGTAWSTRGAEVAVGSLEDRTFLTGALKGAIGFFVLLPPNLGVPDIYAHQREMSDAIAAAVKASAVPHVVLLSSIGADLAAGNGPIKGLHYLENALRAAGTKLTAVRAGMFQENVANSLGAARDAGIYPNFMPSQDMAVPMIATRDIAGVVSDSLLNPAPRGEIIDLQGPAYTPKQVAEMLGAAVGKKLNIIDIPAAGHVAAMTQAGVPKPGAEAYAEMYAGFAAGNITPKGDRLVTGKTTMDETIKTIVQN